MEPKKIRVKAGPGLKVFFPLDVIAAPGRRVRILEGDEVVEVRANMRFVQRSLRCKDLIKVGDSPVAAPPVVQTEKDAEKPRKLWKRKPMTNDGEKAGE